MAFIKDSFLDNELQKVWRHRIPMTNVALYRATKPAREALYNAIDCKDKTINNYTLKNIYGRDFFNENKIVKECMYDGMALMIPVPKAKTVRYPHISIDFSETFLKFFNEKYERYHVSLYDTGMYGMNLTCTEHRYVTKKDAEKMIEIHTKGYSPFERWGTMEPEAQEIRTINMNA